MGILNLTPDSFSDGGELSDVDAVLRRAERMASEGATLLDLGAVSTRPGALAVSQDEEMRRLLPAIEALKEEEFAPLSIDTFRPEVAVASLDLGASMINDVRGGREPGMLQVFGTYQPWICLMHMKGLPQTMQTGSIAYDEVVVDVGSWLADAVSRAVEVGVPKQHILVDPGIGFGKTDEHNLALTHGCNRIQSLSGCPVLYGASRKSIVGRIAAVEDPQRRVPGSLSLAGAAYRAGARVFRVHDVEQTVQFLRLERALRDQQTLAGAH